MGELRMSFRISEREGVIDTSPEIRKKQLEAMRRMTSEEKFLRIAELFALGEQLMLNDVRRLYPNADEWECKMRVAARRVPADLLKKAFGWEPDDAEHP